MAGLKDDHDKIRMGKTHKGSFKKAIATINHLKKLQNEFGRINIGIITTFTSVNQNKIKDTLKGIYEIAKPDNIAITLVRGDPKEKVNLNLDMKLYKDAVDYRDSLFYTKKMPGLKKFSGNISFSILTASKPFSKSTPEKVSPISKASPFIL